MPIHRLHRWPGQRDDATLRRLGSLQDLQPGALPQVGVFSPQDDPVEPARFPLQALLVAPKLLVLARLLLLPHRPDQRRQGAARPARVIHA